MSIFSFVCFIVVFVAFVAFVCVYLFVCLDDSSALEVTGDWGGVRYLIGFAFLCLFLSFFLWLMVMAV